MDIYTFINEIIIASYEGLNILLLFLILINKREFIIRHKLKASIFISSYTIFSYLASTYIPLGYHSMMIAIFMIISLSFITSSRITHSFISVLIIFIFIMATEFIVFLCLSTFKGLTMADIMDIPIIKLQMSLIAKTIQLIIIVFMYRSQKVFFRNLGSDSKDSIYTYLLFGTFLTGVFILIYNYGTSQNANISLFCILLSSLFLLVAVSGFLVYKEKEQRIKIGNAFKLQEEYVKNLEIVVNMIRREKHDFTNHLNTIHAMCMLNKPNTVEKINAYVDKLANNLQSSYHYYHTGNDYIDGLLAVKNNFAFNHNIHFEVDFEVLLDHLSMDEYGLISILGNIIDNAFESITSEENVEGKVVSVCTYMEDNKYHLSIANNGPMISEKNIEKIFENGFSTKKTNKEDHGLGLHIAKQIIEKNNGEIKVLSNEIETEFIIIFDVRENGYGEDRSKYYQFNTAQ